MSHSKTRPLASKEADNVIALRNAILRLPEFTDAQQLLNACLTIAVDIAADPKQPEDERGFLEHVRMLYRIRRAGGIAGTVRQTGAQS